MTSNESYQPDFQTPHSVSLLKVESYMEQVRHLSEEREVLTQEFEMENEQLKKDLGALREEAANGKREVAQMLIQVWTWVIPPGWGMICDSVICYIHKFTIMEWSWPERSSLPDSSSGVSSRMWVRIPAVTLVSLSKTLNHNCFSPPRG